MKLKRILAAVLTLSTAVLAFTGCGSAKTESSAEATTVKIGVVGSIYEDLWKPAQEALKEEGINLEIVQFSDYVTPNNALNSGEIDLNSFQHHIYLNTELEQYGYAIEPVGYTFIIPLNLYSHKVSDVSGIKDGDVIAIPDDVTNGGSYKVNFEIKELKANTIPSVLDDVTAAIVNGNYALDFGLKTEEDIYKDSVLDEEAYWNLIAARTADLQDQAKLDAYRKVVKAFQSEATEKVFNETFGGYFIKVGWDQDLLADK